MHAVHAVHPIENDVAIGSIHPPRFASGRHPTSLDPSSSSWRIRNANCLRWTQLCRLELFGVCLLVRGGVGSSVGSITRGPIAPCVTLPRAFLSSRRSALGRCGEPNRFEIDLGRAANQVPTNARASQKQDQESPDADAPRQPTPYASPRPHVFPSTVRQVLTRIEAQENDRIDRILPSTLKAKALASPA